MLYRKLITERTTTEAQTTQQTLLTQFDDTSILEP